MDVFNIVLAQRQSFEVAWATGANGRGSGARGWAIVLFVMGEFFLRNSVGRSELDWVGFGSGGVSGWVGSVRDEVFYAY